MMSSLDLINNNQTNVLWSFPFEFYNKNGKIKMSSNFFNLTNVTKNSSNVDFFNNNSIHNLVSIFPPARPTIKTAVFSGSHDELSVYVSKVWDNIKKMMGFSPDCRNGGYKNPRGDCFCRPYYKGDYCEEIICLNNGTQFKSLSPLDLTSFTDYCKCPHSEYITGKHCENVKCQNGGTYLGNGHCACVDGWYTGQFCQYYTSSWLLAVGLPLLGVAILIMCCIICRLDLCPRRRPLISERRNRRYYPQQNFLRDPNMLTVDRNNVVCGQVRDIQPLTHLNQDIAGRERTIIIRDNYLNDATIQPNANRNQLVHLNQQNYFVRLEQIPNCNVRSVFPNTPFQIKELLLQQQTGINVEPPPPYDQALLTCHSLNSQPPNYSPQDLRNYESNQNPNIQHPPPPN